MMAWYLKIWLCGCFVFWVLLFIFLIQTIRDEIKKTETQYPIWAQRILAHQKLSIVLVNLLFGIILAILILFWPIKVLQLVVDDSALEELKNA